LVRRHQRWRKLTLLAVSNSEDASLYPFDEEDNYYNTRFNAEGVLIGGYVRAM
jgi:hypothetical protein